MHKIYVRAATINSSFEAAAATANVYANMHSETALCWRRFAGEKSWSASFQLEATEQLVECCMCICASPAYVLFCLFVVRFACLFALVIMMALRIFFFLI
jgi:hypothetical protein